MHCDKYALVHDEFNRNKNEVLEIFILSGQLRGTQVRKPPLQVPPAKQVPVSDPCNS